VTVTFPGDAMAKDLAKFGETLQASTWWRTVTTGYCEGAGGSCIGDATNAKSVVYKTAPATSYADTETPGASSSLRDWLTKAIASGDLPSPEPGPVSKTIYVLYFPMSTSIVLDNLQSCTQFDGYHGAVSVGSQQVHYAVVSECSGPLAGNTPPITTLQNTTITASHEIVESTTDPSTANTAYYLDFSDANLGWMDIEGGGEVADLCIDPFLLDQDETTEGDYTVQRIWSNAHAAAGLDPCNPTPSGEAYFNAWPESSYFVMEVGSSLTFEVNAFSTGTRADWTLTTADWSTNAMTPGYLDFAIAGSTASGGYPSIQVNNGSAVTVTMTLKKDPGGLSNGRADGSIVTYAGPGQNPTAAHFWPFVVLTPDGAVDAGYDSALTGRTGRTDEPPARNDRAHHTFRGRPSRTTPRAIVSWLAPLSSPSFSSASL
jgi:hypothetical protein